MKIGFQRWGIIPLLFIISISYGQKKYDKALQKADDEYEYGDYKKALKKLRSFEKKIAKLGAENKYSHIHYLREARFYWAYGMLTGFEDNLNMAEAVSAKVLGEESVGHTKTLVEIAEIYMLYGNYRTARKYIDNAEERLAHTEGQEELKARSDLYFGKILAAQGYYQEALTHIESHETYFAERLRKKDVVEMEDGSTKTRKLTEAELHRRYTDYAHLLTWKAKTLGDMGNYTTAYDAFEKARDWIADQKRVMGESSTEYALNQYNFANFKVEYGLNLDELGRGIHKDEDYKKTINRLGKGHHKGHYISFDIYETLLKIYLKERKHARYRNLKVEYERNISKSFENNSIHQINVETMDFNSRLERDRTKNLEDRANSLLANNQALPRNHRKTIEILDYLFRISLKEREFDRAENYLARQVEITENLFGEDSPAAHLYRIYMANFYVMYTNKIDEAEAIYKESFYGVVDKQVTHLHKDYLNTLTHIAMLEEYRDNYAKANELLENAMRIALEKYRNKEDIEYAKVLEQVASLQIKLGDYNEGEKKINEVLQIYDKTKMDKDPYTLIHAIKAQETKARLDGIKGYFDEAEKLIRSSQKLLADAQTTEGYNMFNATEELSGLYIFLGNYARSETLLEELLKEYEKVYGTTSGKIVGTLINKGRLELLLGNYADAENYAQRAYAISEKVFGSSSSRTANSLMLLGELYNGIGDYEKAIEYFSLASGINQEKFGENHVNTALSNMQLALAKFYNKDDEKEVEQMMLQAASVIADNLSKENPRYAEASTNLAKIYINSGKYTQAFGALSLAESIWIGITGTKGSRTNVNIGKINMLAGDTYYQQRNYKEAEKYYIKARDIFKRSLNDNHPEYVKTLSKLSRVYYMDGQGSAAKSIMETAIASYEIYIKKYFKSLSEREKAKFWNTIKPDFEFYNTLAIRYQNEDKDAIKKMYNNALMTKALLLNSSIKVRQRILNSGDSLLILNYRNWLESKEQLTKALALNEEQLTESGINLNRLSGEVEQLERDLSNSSEAFSNEIEESSVTWQDVRSSLKDEEVALEMIRFRYFDHTFTDSVVYAVLYVKNSSEQRAPKLITLNNGSDLENKYFKGFNNAIQYKFVDEYSFRYFWEPIIQETGNLSTIYLSPDGIYNQINLESIYVGDGKYVIDNSNIIVISNTKDIYLSELRKKEEKETGESRPALMFGNPDFYLASNNSGDIPPLPGTEVEVSQLRRLMANNGILSDYFTKDEATEQQVKAIESPRVLHIATHGFFRPEAARSDYSLNENEAAKNPLLQTGLIMSGGGDLLDKTAFNYNIDNGILTAYEAMNLDLENTDLVVLSACQTGLGEIEMGEGVYGLQRAFLVAGAETLIMSMFKVADEPTQKLMVNFYTKWISTGNKRKAFIDAKKELRNEYKEPYYWGAFIMIGLN